MGYWRYKPYVPAATRRDNALSLLSKAKEKGVNYTPIEPYKGAIAKTFWGKAWCNNLEHYSDFANRLPRGRTHVRNGSVIDLKISKGRVQGLVMGAALYEVSVSIEAVPQTRWKAVCSDCSSSVASLIELLQGKLSNAVMERICAPTTGLFPLPKEMKFECSCPDWADMCKHVAAVLYGVGARLDQQPDLLFSLRHVDAKELVSQASVAKPGAAAAKSKKVMDDSDLADVFGLDMAEPLVKPKKRETNKPPAKAIAKSGAKKAVVDSVVSAKKSAKTSGKGAKAKAPPIKAKVR